MGFFDSDPANETIKEPKKKGCWINFDGGENVALTGSVSEVAEKLNASQHDIVLFGDVAINRKRVTYIDEM